MFDSPIKLIHTHRDMLIVLTELGTLYDGVLDYNTGQWTFRRIGSC